MPNDRSWIPHYLLRAAIMAAFALYIGYLVKTEQLVYYIAPRMEPYLKFAAVALFVVAAHQAYLALQTWWGRASACGCDPVATRSLPVHAMIYGLFLVPLALGYFLPNQIMGSTVAAMKGMNLSSTAAFSSSSGNKAASQPPEPADASTASRSHEELQPPQTSSPAAAGNGLGQAAGPSEEAVVAELFPADAFTEDFAKLGKKLYKKDLIQVKEEGFMEVLTSVDFFIDRFVGKKMEISGFAYLEEGMKPGQFVVARLAMQCCSADASPYGVLVESAVSQIPAKDAWVQLTGTIGKTKYNGNEIMKLDAVQIRTIPTPRTPYIYPDYEYFDKLQ
ncbi:hypothetical protein PAESOLCIP111_03105 [Paenibacillus solanacearum]|uniref:TIGR03943 family protein n=1 Tax=Paenibacillus solanacearum TaxID=2048548 RepID=A0A916NJM1_9BACL|nr:TIGR03943 family protein [Paenibacillus solanacearum]CAG7629458.1 hypothetical protein PAESOLCIP111_03105 [Paenibacillus solanacearum]